MTASYSWVVIINCKKKKKITKKDYKKKKTQELYPLRLSLKAMQKLTHCRKRLNTTGFARNEDVRGKKRMFYCHNNLITFLR